ncbi:U3 small nucleolar ribonucleoprotein complex, subunit Mpp10 [Tricharina praecox]|uniref:U3 small nucleolar ribonucleoprotein complex, subunit Mpp10 n=1 Tax=Tricharina praecox TaxID=43433 RepID=UPI0022204653|nr:U3 small nucleolar ribonucleoprotein complex, subunit Mpp10 [Tricharina praecox]KAI5859079.1 U3 small nucleolar ribonucleoprotein complex, subunit Mpp10 [Tricharina praecox]
MAGSFASTSSSKTVSVVDTQTPALTSILTHAPHEFLQPSGNAIQDAALNLVKQYFDPLLKKGNNGLGMVYLDGFDVEQVWEQVRGVVENGFVKDLALPARMAIEQAMSESGSESEEEDVVMGEDSDTEASGEEGEFAGFEDETEDEDEEAEDEEADEGGVALEGEDMGDSEDEEDDEEDDSEAKEFVQDVHGLNDGFFSIDDFNRQTELLELEDSRGAPVDEDDDDAVDYDADPATIAADEDDEEEDIPSKNSGQNGLANEDEEGSDDGDDDIDLDQGTGDNGNDLMYEDFFAPPAKKNSGKPKDKKKVFWREDTRKMDPEAQFEAMESNMARVRRDLFDEEDEASDEDVEMGDMADPMNRRSTHQKRQAALMEEIRKLEQENIAKKQWVMAGEAKARDRPLNSLLEEDMDFERSGKPVPVITQEVTEGLEDMIKRRILDAQFDEVIKRRPGDVTDKFRRGRVELDDSKPQESLAEIYAQDHLKSTNPDENLDAADEKVQKEHREIEAIWLDVSHKLDALTSWHFTPKPAKPTLAIVSDAPAISMEEAQPSAAAGGMAANVSMLAPQEIYKPGKDKAYLPVGEGGGREIVGKSGAPISTREMSSDDKKRRRRREKEKIRKRNAAAGITRGEVKAGSKKDVVDTLKRGNVAVIGKGGEKTNVDGTAVKGRKVGTSASFLKL